MEDSKKTKESEAQELPVFKIKADALEIQSMMECPICYNIILSPITVCSSGHSVCNYCKTRLRFCPTCRGGFTTIPNRFAENFLDKCLLTCRNKDKGCSMVLPGGALSKHQEQTCEFRPLLCRQCFTDIPYDMFLAHLQSTEKITLKNDCKFGASFMVTDYQLLGNRVSNVTMKSIWKPMWIRCYGNDFFCFMDQSTPAMEHLSWFVWVGAMGTAQVCEKFRCSITIWNKKAKPRNEKVEWKYVGPVHPVRSQAQTDQVLESGKCLIFSDQNVQNLKHDGGIDVIFSVHYADDDRNDQATSTQSG